jgi:transcriptional regulator with XRE-family HTH domain
MTWRQELGEKIRAARVAKGLTQEALVLALLPTEISRAQISNIEKGKSAPAVNIVTEIALALAATFEIGGCKITGASREPAGSLPPPAQQLCFVFDTDYRFKIGSMRVNSAEPDLLLLSLRLAERDVA